MVTGDEKWVTYDNILRERSRSKRGEAARTVAKPRLTAWKILIPHFETNTELTFVIPARASSVVRGNENPDVGLKCKVFSPNSDNIRQN
ncbi:hypothetical protein TNCV_3264431 [Trichonephila clavipes]|nr:hypothetical protein TNCV_3264431 [Trichonephila clavipes]